MRNAFHGCTQMRSSSTAKSPNNFLLAPADAYNFQRAGSTPSTEAVRTRKLPAIAKMARPWNSSECLEDRGIPVSPKKLPPTPPRDRVCNYGDGSDRSLPSNMQLPRLVGSDVGGLCHHDFETSIFRATPLLLAAVSKSPLSREHEDLYTIHRSLAYEDGNNSE